MAVKKKGTTTTTRKPVGTKTTVAARKRAAKKAPTPVPKKRTIKVARTPPPRSAKPVVALVKRRKPRALVRRRPKETPALALVAPGVLGILPDQDLGAIGLSRHQWSADQIKRLRRPFAVEQYRILPSGEVYIPHPFYRRRLDEVFGPGAWGMSPATVPSYEDGDKIGRATQWFKLMINGLAAGQSIAQGTWVKGNPKSNKSTALEGCESLALVRCCSKKGLMGEAARVDEDSFQYQFRLDHGILVMTHGSGSIWRSLHQPPKEDETGIDERSPNRDKYEKPTMAQRMAASGWKPRGRRDDDQAIKDERDAENKVAALAALLPVGAIEPAAIGAIEKACATHKIEVDALKAFLKQRWGYITRRQILKGQLNEVMGWIRAGGYDISPEDLFDAGDQAVEGEVEE